MQMWSHKPRTTTTPLINHNFRNGLLRWTFRDVGMQVQATGLHLLPYNAGHRCPPCMTDTQLPNNWLDTHLMGAQAVYRLYLDLRAVAASCSDPALLAGFLQRRRPTTVPPSILDVMARSPSMSSDGDAGRHHQQPGTSHSAQSTASEYSVALAGMVLPKQLLFGVVRGSLQERLPMPVLRKVRLMCAKLCVMRATAD